ncbi:MAG TPA: Gfo/Idh/MocA family oxidoreductase [Candidatus Limnocylindrales bacterium]|nr:Gfo/Idh/MocA family oxidoreductase [Candidatus Limnocylindrales bacterium]
MFRVAIMGLGAVTRNIHLPAYSQLRDKVSVVAGCDVDRTARTFMKRKWHLPEVYDNPQELIEKTKPDIVSICTPPSLHQEQSLMALDYGCHVFCEKPLAESLYQADEIIRASERARRLVVVNNQFPYMNIYRSSKALIGSPEFGRLLFLHAWQTFHPTEQTEASWRGKLQRRLCFEFGIHVFELIRFFFEDNPVKIFAHMPNPMSDMTSEVVNIISVEFSDGRAASIVLDRLSKGPEHYLDMRLDGEFASIYTSIGGEIRLEMGLHTREKRPFLGFNFVKGGKAVLQNGNRSKIIAKDGINPFASATAAHFKNFIEAIENGKEPRGHARDNRNTLALALAAYDAAQANRAIEMARYFKI